MRARVGEGVRACERSGSNRRDVGRKRLANNHPQTSFHQSSSAEEEPRPYTSQRVYMTMTARISSDGPHVALKSRQQISSNYNPHANSHDQQQHIDKLITLYEKEHLTNLTLRETVRRLRQEKTLTTRQGGCQRNAAHARARSLACPRSRLTTNSFLTLCPLPTRQLPSPTVRLSGWRSTAGRPRRRMLRRTRVSGVWRRRWRCWGSGGS